jgi:hypothetical protein
MSDMQQIKASVRESDARARLSPFRDAALKLFASENFLLGGCAQRVALNEIDLQVLPGPVPEAVPVG